jgi:ATP-dependent RNA helicase SUPV3L1/SUV3
MNLCKLDDVQYFMCNFDDIKYLAEMIDHIPLTLRAKYTFALSPISRKQPFVCVCFIRFVRHYSRNEPVTIDALKQIIEWPPKRNNQSASTASQSDIAHMEEIYDVFDLYLWLSYRFPNIFCFKEEVSQMRIELENMIYESIKKISSLNKKISINNQTTIDNVNKTND